MKDKPKTMLPDCPLTFPELAMLDYSTLCPLYNQLVKTELEASTLSVEHLDTLKEELELLHSSVTQRVDVLSKEVDVVLEWIEPEKLSAPLSQQSEESVESLDKPVAARSLRDTPCRSETSSPAPARSKNKTARSQNASKDSLGRVPKSDAPEKFWSIVDPYCADITQEDMKVLEELMSSHDDDLDYYKIPSLGKHYSQRWLSEDTEQESKDNSKLLDRKKSLAGQKRRLDSTSEASCSSFDDALLKTSSSDESESPFGPLTERLVSALIEENIINPTTSVKATSTITTSSNIHDPTTLPDDDGRIKPSPYKAQSNTKQLNITNSAAQSQLEKRIRKELEDQGILVPEETTDVEEGDEILAELKQKQQELKAVSQYNLNMTKRLYRLAKDEMSRQDLRRKLAAVDADVIEAYRRVQQARQKKKTVTKREKDSVLKALKERESLVKQIESTGF